MKPLHRLLVALVVLALPLSAAGGGSKPALPSWSEPLPASKRFTVLSAFGGAAVIDNETGLVWEQAPDLQQRNWADAKTHCTELELGHRLGWRLPTVQELESLVDRTQSNPAVPAGHPFDNVESAYYWTVDSWAANTDYAWVVLFSTGFPAQGIKTSNNFAINVGPFVWCVRGGSSTDPL